MQSFGFRRLAAWASCIAVFFLAGCAGLPRGDLLKSVPVPDNVADRVELKDVPFYSQEQYQCGPAALAMVLTFAGAEQTPQNLSGQVYLPQRKGSLQSEMLAATRRAGLLAYVLAPEADALLQQLSAGYPVLVLQNLRFDWLPQWHYAVLIGYDLSRQEVLLHSGTQQRMAMKLSDFNRSWVKAGRWAFVALPPNRLPANAEQGKYLDAAIALERVSPQSAHVAYETAMAQWPDSLVARMGLGNEAYLRHDLPQAEREYRSAAIDHPDAGDAWNNLAQVLHDQGRDAMALEAADKAVAIGGPRQSIYESTRTAIASGTGR